MTTAKICAQFEAHFTKARGFYGDDAQPFEAQLCNGGWQTGEIEIDASDEAIMKLRAEGVSIRDIAGRLGKGRSAVADKIAKLKGRA